MTTPQTKERRTLTPPAPGEYWPGQGGIYVGVARGEPGQPPHHLILAVEAPTRKFTWQEGIDFATTITADGHTDFSVPTRFESALLYANVREKIELGFWYWTSTQYSEDYAFLQYFYSGHQRHGKKSEGRVRFVRRLIIQSFNPLGGAA